MTTRCYPCVATGIAHASQSAPSRPVIRFQPHADSELLIAGRRQRSWYNSKEGIRNGTGRHVSQPSIGLMSLPVMVAVAVATFMLAVAAIRVWAPRSRARPEPPVTEADARAHASPLTRSVLSVTTRSRPGVPGDTDT
jgi:hypothetical protein